MPNPSGQKTYLDSLASFPQGVNSQQDVLLLPPGQLSWAINATNRGSFLSPRPAWVQVPLTYDTPDLQIQFEKTLYQGSGYYKPDSGLESITTQHGGVLFGLTPAGNGMQVSFRVVPGDPNSATAPKVQMWQAERWQIIADGTNANLIFYDGAMSRRSVSNSVVLGTTSAPFTVPAVGSTDSVALNNPFIGTIGQVVLFGGFQYSVANGSGPMADNALLTNVNDSSTNNYPAGTQIISVSNFAGTLSAPGGIAILSPGCLSPGSAAGHFIFNSQFTGSIGQQLQVNGDLWTVGFISADKLTVTVTLASTICFPHPAYPAGTSVYYTSGSTVTVVGTLNVGFNAPALGTNVSISLNPAYTGMAGQIVFIGSTSGPRSTIQSTTPLASSTVFLTNIDAVPAAVVGSGTNILSVPELPPGILGAYGMGHVTLALIDGISFLYGDTVGGPSGSATYNFRDAVLKTTENSFLNSQGAFRIPASGQVITSMTFPAILDAALGQGPLLVGTPFGAYSCLVPTDRSVWASLTNPILPQSLVGNGPLAQDSTISVNSDITLRSFVGLGSFVLGRKEFQQAIINASNSPISTEVVRAFQGDDAALLQFSRAVEFDNRVLYTCKPTLNALGTFHPGLVSMNLDTLSSLQGKLPACYEGLWTGLNILNVIKGSFSNVDRTFAFVLNTASNLIEFWELTKTGSTTRNDNHNTPIQWSFETPVVFNPNNRPKDEWLLRLNNGQLHIKNIFGTVTIKVNDRPDFWPCWVDWFTTTVCATGDKPGYVTPVGLGKPDNSFPPSPSFQRPFRVGRFFQLRIEITGYCEFMGGEFEAIEEPTVTFAKPVEQIPCQTIVCDLPDDFTYSIQSNEPPPPSNLFYNQQVSDPFQCPSPSAINFSGTLPFWITIVSTGSIGKDLSYNIVGRPGIFPAITQAAANAIAQQALNDFISTSTTSGQLSCQVNPP